MNTTLEEEDNADSLQSSLLISNELNTPNQFRSAGVTDMDGVTNELPVLNLEAETGQTIPQAVNNLKGATDADSGLDAASVIGQVTLLDAETVQPKIYPSLESEIDTARTNPSLDIDKVVPMDGVTEPPEASLQPPVLNISTCANKTLTPSAEQICMQSDGVTPNKTFDTANNEINRASIPPTRTNTECKRMDGVITTPIMTADPENKHMGTQNTNSDFTEPNVNHTLDGVTDDHTADTSRETHTEPGYGIIGEILANNEFPEKTLLLGGVTTKNRNEDPTTITRMETGDTLPDLVSKTTNSSVTEVNTSQHRKKTPTERLLDVFRSPIPSDIEDAEMPMEMGEYQTTEDEDDAIDGLLALSNTSHPGVPVKNPTGSPKTSLSVKESKTSKQKVAKKGKSNKVKKRNKKRKANKGETEQLEKQLEDMNIEGRKSR